MSYTEDNLLQLSALEHFIFCVRQCALIHLEQAWGENLLTAEGKILHEKTHQEDATESRGDVRIARGLRLHSLQLGLAGKADVVEFHRVKDNAQGVVSPSPPATQTVMPQSAAMPGTRTESIMSPSPVALPEAVALPGIKGLWQPFPVEYKRGILRHEEGFEVQLCAQALCIEEMMNVHVPAGAVFYGKTARRLDVTFDVGLRAKTEDAATRLHKLFSERKTPSARYEKKCDKCSLLPLCMPKATGVRRSVKRYLADVTFEGEDKPT